MSKAAIQLAYQGSQERESPAHSMRGDLEQEDNSRQSNWKNVAAHGRIFIFTPDLHQIAFIWETLDRQLEKQLGHSASAECGHWGMPHEPRVFSAPISADINCSIRVAFLCTVFLSQCENKWRRDRIMLANYQL